MTVRTPKRMISVPVKKLGAYMTDYDNYIPPGEFSCRADSRRLAR